jgi:hypothetical protein
MIDIQSRAYRQANDLNHRTQGRHPRKTRPHLSRLVRASQKYPLSNLRRAFPRAHIPRGHLKHRAAFQRQFFGPLDSSPAGTAESSPIQSVESRYVSAPCPSIRRKLMQDIARYCRQSSEIFFILFFEMAVAPAETSNGQARMVTQF